jgi:hypothetical protein
MVAASGDVLLEPDAITMMRDVMLPLATVRDAEFARGEYPDRPRRVESGAAVHITTCFEEPP